MEQTFVGAQGEKQREQNKFIFFFLNFFVYPLRAGLFGFSAFFTTVLDVKYMGTFIDPNYPYNVEISDIYLSSLGFFLIFTIRFLENFKEDKKEK